MKTILVDAINTFVVKGEGVFEEMYNLLEDYPNEKIILTNADSGEMEKFGLDEMPYQVFSLNHDPEKTDPMYYETFLEQLGLNAEDVVYFEHNKSAIESAESVGIKTHYYSKERRDLDELKDFLDSNL